MTCDTLTTLAKIMDIISDTVCIIGLPSVLHTLYDNYQAVENGKHSMPSALWWGFKYWLKHRNLSFKACYELGLKIDRSKYINN